MVSRLDRLFILLDTGSNESIRLAAAKQLGEVQRVQPNDLSYLLQRIKEYSSKSVWETRVASGHATRCVLEQVGAWPPQQQPTSTKSEKDDKGACHQDIAQRLIEQDVNIERILEEFDLEKIVASCPKLLSTDVNEADYSLPTIPTTSKGGSSRGSRGRKESISRPSSSSLRKSDKEQLLRQRKLINKELGIAMVDSLNLGVKSTDIVSNDDLQTEYVTGDMSPIGSKFSSSQHDIQTTLQRWISNYEKVMDRLSQANCISIPTSVTSKERGPVKQDNNEDSRENSPSSIISDNESNDEWPLKEITGQYANDLFNPSWEVRHGAAIALREIVKLQGNSAGKRSDLPSSLNDTLNQLWLVDMALKALSVLALDKFGDFLFDQVVAPVRENAAQLLGCCVAHMSEPNARSAIKLLLKMLDKPNWEIRHGGILGLKYSLNVFNELFSKSLLQECFDPIFKCLGDSVDDVSAEAAASLVPVKDLMIETIPDKAPKLIKFLWDHLADLDELTTSTSNIVLLLASLITCSSAQLDSEELTRSIPRLWSLLNHSSTSVRISVLKALTTLTKPSQRTTTCLTWMPEDLLTTALRLVFQRSILENMEEVCPYIEEVWMQLIQITTDSDASSSSQNERFKLLKCTSQYLNYWLCLVLQPSNTPIDRGSPMWLNIGPAGCKSDIRPDGEVYIGSCTFNAETLQQQKIQVTKCRLLGTRLLGALYANLINGFDNKQESAESQHAKETLKYLADMFIHYVKTKSANQRIISGWALESWASHQRQLLGDDHETKLRTILPASLIEQINSALQETSLCYDELASTFTRLQQETRDFVAAARQAGVELNLASISDKRAIYNLNQIQYLCSLNLETELGARVAASKKPPTIQNSSSKTNNDDCGQQLYTTLSNKKANLTRSLKLTNLSQKTLSTSVLSSMASAHISWRLTPQKIDLLIKPLLDSIELEEEQSLQDKSINYLVILFDVLSQDIDQYNDSLESILERLIDTLSCKTISPMISSTVEQPQSDGPSSVNTPPDSSSPRQYSGGGGEAIYGNSKRYGFDSFKIILLDNLQRKAQLSRSMSRRQSSLNSTSSLKRSHSLATSSSLDIDNDGISAAQDGQDNSGPQSPSYSGGVDLSDVKLRGASIALAKLSAHFGDKLPEKMLSFWNLITRDIRSQVDAYRKQPASSSSGVGQSGGGGGSSELKLLKSLQLLEVVGESLDDNLKSHLLDLFVDLVHLLTVPNPIIRHHSAQCIGVLSKLMLSKVIELISDNIIPMLRDDDNTLARCGSIEAVALIIEHLQLELVPYIDMFIIQVLRRMSDQNDQVRLMATHCFGKLLSLMPLNLEKTGRQDDKVSDKEEAGDASSTTTNSKEKRDDQRFMEQLLDPKKLDNFVVPFEMTAQLRSYQQGGLNWLAFLNRFNLHGILCDEMGLGKTLMTICMVASDHFMLQKRASKATGGGEEEEDSGRGGGGGKQLPSNCQPPRCPPPSLIVCPSTLTGHWLYEIEKFLSTKMRSILNPVAYTGNLSDRTALRCQILDAVNKSKQEAHHQANDTNEQRDLESSRHTPAFINLVVASYDIVRNDIDFFKGVQWNYCVLDEGHIIKNGKSKLSRAIRLLTARHRLILSGTPIQNNVTELWSLFDFLMPGFLGSERQFNSRFTKPILQSREFKCSARELEAGALAMESLHRQVLPFILRRLKEDVLDDLPPKIIQDYYCELSPLQCRLYEDFTRSKLCNEVTKKSIHQLEEDHHQEASTTTVTTGSSAGKLQQEKGKSSSRSHVFQALQYLKNVCNHPKLVLTERHSQYLEIKKSLDMEKSSLDDISHSSKLKALKQLLIDCGIGGGGMVNGAQSATSDERETQQQQQQDLALQSVVNQHRALIFCQIRRMVDIIENDLLKRDLPGITYLKLDGSVPAVQRHSIVSRFNNDPSIDVLLLTTQIGGLGLNLTGADTVIFVEHDWNPTKDLQAMDRAHRIGQKKVVNVYRLITKGTLEEKIMGLQKFKTMVSNTVINQDNAGLGTMNVDQLFDLFDNTSAGSMAAAATDKVRSQGDGGGGGRKSSKSATTANSNFMDLLPELWDEQQYETEYDLSTFVSSLRS